MMFAILFSACIAYPSEIIYAENTEPIPWRDWPEDESDTQRDAEFLLRRLPLNDMEEAQGIATMLYAFYITDLRSANVVRRGTSTMFENDIIFRIVDNSGNTYYVEFDPSIGIVMILWRLNEDGHRVIYYSALPLGFLD